jgi:hypothetical protein
MTKSTSRFFEPKKEEKQCSCGRFFETKGTEKSNFCPVCRQRFLETK